jgi:hypothetical protein
MNLEDALIAGLVAKMFEPEITGNDQGGGPYYQASRASMVLSQWFERDRNRIVAAVAEAVNTEEFAHRVATRFLADVESYLKGAFLGASSSGGAFARDVRTRVVELVAQHQANALLAEEGD